MLLLSVILVSSVTAQYKIKVKGYVTGQTEGHNNVYLYNQIKRTPLLLKTVILNLIWWNQPLAHVP